MSSVDEGPKPLAWLHGEVKTPPFTPAGRREIGALLRQLQMGHSLGMPHSRPMPSIGRGCHELRVRDEEHSWRLIYRVDRGVIAIAGVFDKRTRATPKHVIEACQGRLAAHDRAIREARAARRKGRRP